MASPNVHRACSDFHQTSEATRRRYLETPLTRRQVVARGLGTGLAIYAANAISLAQILESAEAEAVAAPDAPVLVSVFLPGGCDLLDTLVPLHQYGAYADLRGRLGLREAQPLGGSGLGFHPALGKGLRGGVKGLFDQGKIGFLPGIDYANPDLSHFHSRHFWDTGLVTSRRATGWLGRWLDHNGSPDNPLQGISMSSGLSPLMRSGSKPVAAVSSPNDAQFWIPGVWGEGFDRAMETYGELASRRPTPPGPAAAASAARMARTVADRLMPYRSDDNGVDPLAPPVVYPQDNELGKRLSHLAGMLSLPLGIRVASVEAAGDFDTHDNQPQDLERNLTDVSEALSAFQADLEARGLANRVLTFVWSEFGRRAQPNESRGTDHGAGGVAWVQGTRARAGVLSDYPELTKLDAQDNLAVTIDFRRVYCSLIEQWLAADAGAVIPNAAGFGRLRLVA